MLTGLYHPIDFEIWTGNTLTVQVNIKDEDGDPVTPVSGAIGRFAIAPAPGSTALVERNSISDAANVWFTTTAPFWFLNANILAADTAALAPGIYYYELRLDSPLPSTQNTIKAGWFLLKPSAVTP